MQQNALVGYLGVGDTSSAPLINQSAMTSVELLREIEAFLCFNSAPDKDNCMALKKSIQDHLAEIDSKPRSDFDVMSEMASKNMGIRMTPHFVEAKLAKGGGHVTMGVDAAVIHDLVFSDKFGVALYIVDFEQFSKLKNQQQCS